MLRLQRVTFLALNQFLGLGQELLIQVREREREKERDRDKGRDKGRDRERQRERVRQKAHAIHVYMYMYFFQKVSLPSDLNIHKLKLSCPRSGPLQSLPSDDVFYDTTDSMTVGPDSDSDGGVATDRRIRYCTCTVYCC